MIFGRNREQMLPVTGEKLIDLIPQKMPFVLISALNEVTEKTCSTTFRFNADHVLCNNGKLSSAGLMENIAQTCAAKMGYECWLQGKKIPIGFIGDVRDFEFTRLPQAGEELCTEIMIENKIFDVLIISGQIRMNGEVIASCKMKIFVEPEPVASEKALGEKHP